MTKRSAKRTEPVDSLPLFQALPDREVERLAAVYDGMPMGHRRAAWRRLSARRRELLEMGL